MSHSRKGGRCSGPISRKAGGDAGGKAGASGLKLLPGTVCHVCFKDVGGQPISKSHHQYTCSHPECNGAKRTAGPKKILIMMVHVEQGDERKDFLKEHKIEQDDINAAAKRQRGAKGGGGGV